MCEPTTLAMASLAMGTVGAVAQYDQASSQASYQNALNKRNYDAAIQNMQETQASLQLQDRQNFEAAQQGAEQNARETRRVASTARVAAGESGIMGSTVDALFREIAGQGAANESSIYTNYLRMHEDTNNQMQGLQRQTANTVTNLTPAQGPSALVAGLKIGGIGMDSYSNYMSGKFGSHDNMWKKA